MSKSSTCWFLPRISGSDNRRGGVINSSLHNVYNHVVYFSDLCMVVGQIIILLTFTELFISVALHLYDILIAHCAYTTGADTGILEGRGGLP